MSNETPVEAGNVPPVAITINLRPNSHSNPRVKRQFGRKLVFLHDSFTKTSCLDCNSERAYGENRYCGPCNELNNFFTAITEVYREREGD